MYQQDAQRGVRSLRRALTLILTTLLLIGVTSCGSTESAKPRTDAATTATLAPELEARYEKLFAGGFRPPPTDVPAAVRGKTVWIISCGRNFNVCTRVDGAFEEAARVLGWNVKVHDSAGDAQKTINGIRLAISSKADAVATVATDCAGIKSALLEAKNAGIPVFNYHGTDCPNEPLNTANLKFAGVDTIVGHFAKRGAAAATLLAALLGKRGITSGEVLEVKSLGQAHHAAYWEAYEKQLAIDAPGLKLVPVEFTNAQLPNPASQVWRTAVTAHPDAVGLAFNSDNYLNFGLGAIAKGAQNKNLVVCCGSGENRGAFEDGTINGADFEAYEYYAWALADTINQYFAGVAVTDLPDQGGGSALFDAGHKAAAGNAFEAPVDYKKIRTEAWTK